MDKNRIIVVALLLIVAVVLFAISFLQNNETFVYPLDDPYIHMANAKNFAESGVWGVTLYEFTSSSSSPLWTLLLSGIFLILGSHTAIPFLLNIVVSIGLIVLVSDLLDKHLVSAPGRLFILMLMLFVTPLPAMIFSGQEHVLHALIVIGFVVLSSRILSTPGKSLLTPESRCLLLLSPLVTMVRYEGMFLIIVVCLLYTFKRRLFFAMILCTLGFLPVLIMGLLSMYHGWFFFPNSVYIKGNLTGIHTLGDFTTLTINSLFWMQSKLVRSPVLLFLMLLAVFTYIYNLVRKKKFWSPQQVMLLIFFLVAFFHAIFAHTAWFYRYEAYLVALGLFVVLPVLFEFFRSFLRPYIKETSLSSGRLYLFALAFCVPCIALVSILLYTQPDCRSWKGWLLWYETKFIASMALSCVVVTFLDCVILRKEMSSSEGITVSIYYTVVLTMLGSLFVILPHEREMAYLLSRWYRYETYVLSAGLIGMAACLREYMRVNERTRDGGCQRLEQNVRGAIIVLFIFSSCAVIILRRLIDEGSRLPWYGIILDAILVLSISALILGDLPGMLRKTRINLKSITSTCAAVLVLAFLLWTFLFMIDRTIMSLVQTPQAMNDRYFEHYKAAQFVKRYYNDATIVVNDIGMMAYYTNARILDLYGLGSKEPVVFRRKPTGYVPRDLYLWAQSGGADIAVLQPEWGEVWRRLPPEWLTVAEWKIPRNVVFGDTTVRFYAVDPAETERLIKSIQEFTPYLPPMVIQRIREL